MLSHLFALPPRRAVHAGIPSDTNREVLAHLSPTLGQRVVQLHGPRMTQEPSPAASSPRVAPARRVP